MQYMVSISGLCTCDFCDMFVFCEGYAGQIINLMTLHST